MDDTTLATLRTAAGAVFDVGFAAMVGALLTRALLNDAASDWALRCRRRCRRLLLRASLLALAASLAWMAVQAVAMTELPWGEALLAVVGIVRDTPFGRAWAVVVLALGVAIALVVAHQRRATPLVSLALAATIVAAAHASTGHAGANGLGTLTLVMAVHVLATAAWAGAVFAAALCLPRGDVPVVDGPGYARRLSTVATASLAVVALTGGAGAWHELGGTLAPMSPSSHTDWGVVLDVKLALVALAVALGGFNRFAVMPSLPSGWRRFERVLRIEAVVLLAALVAAAVLANGEPPVV